MLDKIKYFAKVSSMAVITLLKIYALAAVTFVVSLTIAFIFLLREDDPGAVAPHVGGKAGLLALIVAKPWESLLIFLIFCCSVALIAVGYKYVVSKVIHRLISDKAEPLLYPVLDKITDRIRSTANGRGRAVELYAGEKLRMLQAVKSSSENVWVRRALAYGLRKIQVSDEDLKGNADVYELIKQKSVSAIKEASAPNKTLLWILVVLQLAFALIIAFI